LNKHSPLARWERVSRPASFGLLALAYAVALAAAWAAAVTVGPADPVTLGAWAYGAATLAVFALSLATGNSSLYDPFWSVGPPLLAVSWAAGAEEGAAVPARQILALALVWAWGARLTWNFSRGWPGMRHEDWRYTQLRQQTGALYWVVSFVGIHAMPSVLTFAGTHGFYPALAQGAAPLGLLDALGATLAAAALALETTADQQLRRFVLSRTTQGAVLDTGVWAWCRHPNYLGEMGFWWGMALLGLAADPGFTWAIAGAAGITLMFVFVSVPLLDRRSMERRPAYAEHMRRVPALFPRPWQR
jgi:steroid 5-alpha reductase family enzyme